MLRYGYLYLVAGCFVTAATAFAATPPTRGVINSITLTNVSGAAISNYPFQFGRPFLDGAIANAPQVLLNGTPLATQADIKNRYPDGSVEFAVIAVVIPALPASGSSTLTFQNQTAASNTPLTKAQMLQMQYMFDAKIILTPTTGGTAQKVDARTMLMNGDYTLWTSGPVAQTIMLADDTAARKYDIGLGDGFHPFRPRFYATFWPATHQVFVRVVGENDNPQELEDLTYNLTLTAANAIAYSKSGLTHYVLTRWTKTFWLGGTPNPEVNIDNNLAYLESTRFLPNFDPSVAPNAADIASEYASWTASAHDLYDGAWDGGLWQNLMGTAGDRPDIGPYPSWTTMWLYSGDWRLRQMALGMADLAGAFPGNLRESAPGHRLSRADPPGSSTGLGYPVDNAGRPTLLSFDPGYLLGYGYTTAADKVIQVGPIGVVPVHWSFDDEHQPSPFFPQYILTGDPWYLDMMNSWAGFSSMMQNGAASPGWGSPGPSGDYGGIVAVSITRGWAWVERNRAEAAFADPDASPLKAVFTYLTNDAIAAQEGGLRITGTPYDGSPIKLWGSSVGDAFDHNGGPDDGQPPPLHNWASLCDPAVTTACSYVTDNETAVAGVGGGNCDCYPANTGGSYEDIWMDDFVLYALGRSSELGFAAKPLQDWSGQFWTGMLASSVPQLIAQYQWLPEKLGGGWFPTWAAEDAALNPQWVNGTEPGGGLPAFFTTNLGADGRQEWATAGLAMLVDQNAPGAASAWAWWLTNVYDPVKLPNPPGCAPGYGCSWDTDPKWAIVPRTDTNALPPITTVTPPG